MAILAQPVVSPGAAAIRGGQPWSCWAGLFGLAVLFLLLRWNNFNAPLIRDEGEYLYAAQMLQHGQAPYEAAFIQKPPMVVYSYWLANTVLPGVFWAPRLLAAVFVALATLLLGGIARREFGAGHALPVMWLMTPMVFLPGMEQVTANTEMFLLLPLLGVFALYSRARQGGAGIWPWFAAGGLAATALLYKYTALPLLVLALAAWSWETWRAGRQIKPLLRCHAALWLGGLLAAAAELGFFLAHDHGATWWDCTVTFNRHYMASDNFGWAGLWLRLRPLLAAWWILVPLAGAAFWSKPRFRVWFWAAALAAAMLATGGSYYGQYYILLAPFGALLAVAGLSPLAAVLARRSSFTAGQIRTGLLVLAMLLVLLPDASWLTLPPRTFAAAKYASISIFMESPVVGRRVAELSSPGDPVWVAASEPQILAYAQRPSATRFITVYALVIPSPEQAGYQAQAMAEVQASHPALAVWAPSWLQQTGEPSPYLRFINDTLARDYERVGGYVRETGHNHWAEPINDEEARNASVLLFKRKAAASPAPPAS